MIPERAAFRLFAPAGLSPELGEGEFEIRKAGCGSLALQSRSKPRGIVVVFAQPSEMEGSTAGIAVDGEFRRRGPGIAKRLQETGDPSGAKARCQRRQPRAQFFQPSGASTDCIQCVRSAFHQCRGQSGDQAGYGLGLGVAGAFESLCEGFRSDSKYRRGLSGGHGFERSCAREGPGVRSASSETAAGQEPSFEIFFGAVSRVNSKAEFGDGVSTELGRKGAR